MWKWAKVGLFGQCRQSEGSDSQDWYGTEMFIQLIFAVPELHFV